MVLAGKLSVELEIKSSPDKYFHAWMDIKNLFSKAIPDDLHKCEVHEGDGKSLNSINHFYYVLDGATAVSTKAKIETIDEVNKLFTLNVFDGHVGELYSKYKLHVQVFTKYAKNYVKCTIEYEKLSEEVVEPINYLEVVTKMAKGLDAHLLQA